jgi:hypothetical protein
MGGDGKSAASYGGTGGDYSKSVSTEYPPQQQGTTKAQNFVVTFLKTSQGSGLLRGEENEDLEVFWDLIGEVALLVEYHLMVDLLEAVAKGRKGLPTKVNHKNFLQLFTVMKQCVVSRSNASVVIEFVRQKFEGLPSPDLVSSAGSEPGATEVWLFGHLKEKLRQLTKQDDTIYYHMERIVLGFKVGAKPEHESAATHYSNHILRFHNFCLDLEKVAAHEVTQKGPGSELKPSSMVAIAKANEPRDAFLRAQGKRVTLKDLVCGTQDDPFLVVKAALRACVQLEETARAAHVELQRVF